jgi:hypothetical protein
MTDAWSKQQEELEKLPESLPVVAAPLTSAVQRLEQDTLSVMAEVP